MEHLAFFWLNGEKASHGASTRPLTPDRKLYPLLRLQLYIHKGVLNTSTTIWTMFMGLVSTRWTVNTVDIIEGPISLYCGMIRKSRYAFVHDFISLLYLEGRKKEGRKEERKGRPPPPSPLLSHAKRTGSLSRH